MDGGHCSNGHEHRDSTNTLRPSGSFFGTGASIAGLVCRIASALPTWSFEQQRRGPWAGSSYVDIRVAHTRAFSRFPSV
jgi:hypothetical protein